MVTVTKQVLGKTVQIEINDAKCQLEQLVDSALNGDEVIITQSGRAVVQLVSCGAETERPEEVKREFGMLRGQIEISDEFDSLQIHPCLARDFGLM